MRIHRLLMLLGLVVVSSPSFSENMENLVLRDGLYYHPSGKQPFSGEITGQNRGSFKGGLRHGVWIHFHDNGEVKSQGGFKNGLKHGSWTGFYENGQLFYKGHYVEGKKDGLWVSYYDDATLFYQGNFEDGKENGLWKGFNPDGTPWAFRTGLFRNGIKISE